MTYKQVRIGLTSLVLVALLATMSGCAGPRYGKPGKVVKRLGDEIVVCGQLVHTGAPVVLWMDPGGYDGYRAHQHFNPDEWMPSKPVSSEPVRFGSWRRHLPPEVAEQVRTEGWNLELLGQWVDLFVLHYDACGTSRRCFEVLHDRRGLSVHFMLDLDGTIYQTLDVKERAWHAGSANNRSVGIEIANIGAYPDMDTLNEWYGRDEDGRTVVTRPERFGESGIRTADYVARPARDDVVTGEINGRELYQYDLTDAQYKSLIKLTAALCRTLPRITPAYPTDESGALRREVLPEAELEAYHGILGHWHITRNKVDPGPAFDWDRLLDGVEHELRW